MSVETGVEALDEDTTVAVGSEVHPRRYGGAVVHAEGQVSGVGVGQKTGQHVHLTLLLHHLQGCAAGPEQNVWIWWREEHHEKSRIFLLQANVSS